LISKELILTNILEKAITQKITCRKINKLKELPNLMIQPDIKKDLKRNLKRINTKTNNKHFKEKDDY
jgi:hypothetical protein